MAKRKTPIAWHYPRTSLAQTYLRTLDAGLISSLVLFAPRRKGKTEFLLEDLLPAAESSGYRAVYCSMWQHRTDPLSALLASFMHAARPRAKLHRRLLLPFKKTSIEVEVEHLGKLSAEAEFLAREDAEPDRLQRLPELLDAVIAASKGGVLIAFDEIQHLAKPEFQELVAALRTTLDLRKKSVKSVFTGSSRHRLQMMFSQIKAPLFQFSQTTDFPDLDDEFVIFMAAAFQRATRRRLSLSAAHNAFVLLGRTPGLFHDAIERLMKSGDTDIEEVARHVQVESHQAAGYAPRLAAMRPLDRVVLNAVLKKMALYSDESRSKFSTEIGIEGELLTARQIQVAVERLLSEQIIYQSGRGQYEIEDHQLAEWLLMVSGDDEV
ncbi:hypothetical protein FHW83_002453 [Duganella sp. SG902]|uniref:hypothetical protein n=1 Tax=Duganella sp. SG902 TaxID=2587016 RepID=UPI00159DE25C|nr:hypothetical protein [Duganella sp. SG902]NVM76652.1 hypothetical protein [Duganella sp. SG902]